LMRRLNLLCNGGDSIQESETDNPWMSLFIWNSPSTCAELWSDISGE
jgi:hypothetical protein